MAFKTKKKRAKSNIDVPIILVLFIILATFLGSALLFWGLNTKALRASVMAETNLSSSLLADDINATVPTKMLLSGTADSSLSEKMKVLKANTENINDAWIVDSKGQIYYRNESETGVLIHDEEVKDIIASYLEDPPKDDILIRWIGKGSWLLLQQQCCIVRPLYGGSLYLVMVNHANSDRAMQRQQFALLMLIDVMLMLVMIVLVVNTSVNYRRQMIRFATTDELTGLANRKNFSTEYAEFIEEDQAPPFSLFLLDIDFFKHINDNYGHAAGDHALSFLAQQIQEMVRENDGFAGRWGGDEFIGVLPLRGDKALAQLRKLCKTIEASESEDGFKMTISAGVVFAGKETYLNKLSEKADLALYESKENGRNQASLYDPNKMPEATPEGSKAAAGSASDASSATNAAMGLAASGAIITTAATNGAASSNSAAMLNGSAAAEGAAGFDGSAAAESVTGFDGSAAANGAAMVNGSAIPNGAAMPNGSAPHNGSAAFNGSAISNASAMSGTSAQPNASTAPGNITGSGNNAAFGKTAAFGNGAKPATGLASDSSLDGSESQKKKRTILSILKGIKNRISIYVHGKLLRSTLLGVRWMARFVAGGGILIALAFLFDAASVDFASLTVSERAAFGSITLQAATLKTIGGITFNFMLPVFAGFMAYGLAGEEAFLTGFVGGYMAIDCNAGFIGAMIAGFSAGIITSEVGQFTNRLPKFIRKAAPIIIYPVFNLLLMQVIVLMVISPVSTAIGSWFSGILKYCAQKSSIAAGALSGMMMAVDMGGIVNKVAYNYGVNGILAGHTDIMASVMIGGMVPPIGIALSTLIFKKQKKFSVVEHDHALSAFFMGVAFITEGALPYVFTDILRVIPTCMLGSGIAGLLSALFGCKLPAPHGGIFVLPVMSHPILYLVAIAIGSLVTAVTLGMLKKQVVDDEEEQG